MGEVMIYQIRSCSRRQAFVYGEKRGAFRMVLEMDSMRLIHEVVLS